MQAGFSWEQWSRSTEIKQWNTYREVLEQYRAPLILDIEEDKEDTDHHGDDDGDNHKQATVHPATGPQAL